MFTKNSPKGVFVNGTLGEVVEFKHGSLPVVKAKSGRRIIAEPMDWTIEDGGRVLARVSQIPLRLAWALTIHKSQGMFLDAAFIDLRQAFVEGQGYVALSRLRSLSGLFLAGYNQQALAVHPQVLARDQEFRSQSQAVAGTFANMPPEELQTMHGNFIKTAGGKMAKQGAYSVASIRDQHPNAYRGWNKEEMELLIEHYHSGKSVAAISELLGRKPGAIRARLEKIGLVKA